MLNAKTTVDDNGNKVKHLTNNHGHADTSQMIEEEKTKLKKSNIIIMTYFLLISGCKNHIPYSYIDHVVNMSEVYCRQSALKQCSEYRVCISEKYNQVKSKAPLVLASSRIIIIQGSPGIMKNGDFTNLIKNSYNLLDKKNPVISDLDLEPIPIGSYSRQ